MPKESTRHASWEHHAASQLCRSTSTTSAPAAGKQLARAPVKRNASNGDICSPPVCQLPPAGDRAARLPQTGVCFAVAAVRGLPAVVERLRGLSAGLADWMQDAGVAGDLPCKSRTILCWIAAGLHQIPCYFFLCKSIASSASIQLQANNMMTLSKEMGKTYVLQAFNCRQTI